MTMHFKRVFDFGAGNKVLTENDLRYDVDVRALITAMGGGGGSGASTVDGITDASATGKLVMKAANAAAARTAIGAGTSSFDGTWTSLSGKPRLDQITAPTAAVALNGQELTVVGDPTTDQSAATKAYVDSRQGTLANLVIGGTFTVKWNGSAWTYNGATISARPTTRTNVTMLAIGGTAVPSFALAGDLWAKDLS